MRRPPRFSLRPVGRIAAVSEVVGHHFLLALGLALTVFVGHAALAHLRQGGPDLGGRRPFALLRLVGASDIQSTLKVEPTWPRQAAASGAHTRAVPFRSCAARGASEGKQLCDQGNVTGLAGDCPRIRCRRQPGIRQPDPPSFRLLRPCTDQGANYTCRTNVRSVNSAVVGDRLTLPSQGRHFGPRCWLRGGPPPTCVRHE